MTIRHEKIDVAIMGAGAAGAMLAARFAEAGRKVVVLEAGPAWQMSDLVSSQIWSRRLKWGGSPVETAGAHRLGHNVAVGWGIGGSALHHYAGWPRLQPEDFKFRSAFGRGLDWPIGYDELRPWYDRVQAEVGLSGDAEKEVWRPAGAPYPMPPLKTFKQGMILAKGFAALGMRVAPAPMAVTSVAFKDRAPCQYDGWCDAGCPIGALFNPLVLHIPAARKAGAEIRTGATVTHVETDGRGRVEGLRYADDRGETNILLADLVILAGAAVQNARLLLASQSPHHPDGLGNRTGMVGRYFNAHSISNSYAICDEDTECHLGLAVGTLTSQDDYAKARGSGPVGSVTWALGPALKPNDLLGIAGTRPELFGRDLHAFLGRAAKRMAAINGLVESIGLPDNRITLTGQKDRFGVPSARITHSLDPNSEALWHFVNDRGIKVMRAAGSNETWFSKMIGLAHVAGGTVMGSDPEKSVVNSYGQLHDAPNLVVAGGGQFPSIGAVSPTFTVLALAERAFDRMRAHPGDFRV